MRIPAKSTCWKYYQKSITISEDSNFFCQKCRYKALLCGSASPYQTFNKLLVNITRIHHIHSRLLSSRKLLIFYFSAYFAAEINSGTDSKPFYYHLAICWVLYLQVNSNDLNDLLHWIVLEFLERCNNTIASKPAQCIKCEEKICNLCVLGCHF